MKPSTAHTVIIGGTWPVIVEKVVKRNRELFKFYGVDFIVHELDRDKKYLTAGLQAEHFKMALLGYFDNVMVFDWDVYFDEIPDVPYEATGFGTWRPIERSVSFPDGFLVCNHNHDVRKITETFERANIKTSNGYMKRYATFICDFFTYCYIDPTMYCHLNLNTGLSGIDYGDLPKERQAEIERKAYENLLKWGATNGIAINGF